MHNGSVYMAQMKKGAYLCYSAVQHYQYMTDLMILDECRADRPVLLADRPVLLADSRVETSH